MTAKPIPEGYHSLTPIPHRRRRPRGARLLRAARSVPRSSASSSWAASSCTPSCGSATRSSPSATRSRSSGWPRPKPGEPLPGSILIYTEDVDALYDRALAAGATELNRPSDQFHGDRAGSLKDPYGHRWMLATHTEDMSEEEMQRRTEEAMAGSG